MISLIKILTWLASPIGILTVCSLVAGSLLSFKRALRFRRLILAVGISQLLIFAWPPVAVSINQGLENKARQLQAQNTDGPYVAILLLGGGVTPALPNGEAANAREGFDRIIYAAQLYQQGVAPRIIVSGGTGLRDEYPDAETEALTMKAALILMGIPENAILTEDQSLNTRQNVAYTADLLQQSHIAGRLALVTTATHIPRATNNARRSGLLIDAYPTDWQTSLPYRPFAQRWLPNAKALEESETSLKEWIALLANY